MSTDITFEDIPRIQLMKAKAEVNIELDSKMEYYYKTFVIPECQAIARAANCPQGFVQGFDFVKTGFGRGKIINTFGSMDNPLAKYFNYGTKKNYLIEPKVQHPAGSPRSPRDAEQVGTEEEPKVVHPTMLKITLPDGTIIFRPAAIHPGIEKSMALEDGTQLGTKRLIIAATKDIGDKFGKSD